MVWSKAARLTVGVGLLVSMPLSLPGCSQADPVETVNYRATASVHDFMYWFLEPAADVLWDSAGYIITEAGEQDLQPTTQAGWDRVRNSATMVAEAGNLLVMPGYRVQEEAWLEYARGVTVAGMAARDAALAQDADALFTAGGHLYNACRACHNRYIQSAADDSPAQ